MKSNYARKAHLPCLSLHNYKKSYVRLKLFMLNRKQFFQNILLTRAYLQKVSSQNLLRPSQFLGKFQSILEGPFCRNKSGLSYLLNVSAYWKNSNTEACAKKLS